MKRLNKSKIRIFFDLIGYCIFCLIFVLICVVSYQLFSKQQPNLFGYCLYYIQTDSMDGEFEDSFSSQSVVISKMIDEDDCYDLKVGDIITFVPTDVNLPDYITTKTHRIISIDYNNQTIITKGDANSINDSQISFSDVKAKFIKISPILTSFIFLVKSFWGFLLFIFLPIFLLIIFQIYSYFLEKKQIELKESISKIENEKQVSIDNQKKEIEKQAIKDYLESINKMKNN